MSRPPAHNQKYFGVTKGDIEAAQFLADRLLEHKVSLSAPFAVIRYGGSLHSVPGCTAEYDIGILMMRLSLALEELELAYYAATGVRYKQKDLTARMREDFKQDAGMREYILKERERLWSDFEH